MNNFPEEVRKLEGKWVAFDKETNEVLEFADTLRELKGKLNEAIYRVVFFKVPQLDVNWVPLGC